MLGVECWVIVIRVGHLFMKYPLSFGIVVWLVCGGFLFAPTSSPASEDKQEGPAVSNPTLPNAMNGVLGSINGAWEGDLTFLQGATLSQKEPVTARYRITIQGSAVRVYMVRPKDVKEVKPGLFHIERLLTNAIIYAIQSGEDSEGTWVETWVFAVTKQNETTLLTNFSRIVNNVDLPLSNDHSKFAKQAAGELKLIPASSSEPQGSQSQVPSGEGHASPSTPLGAGASPSAPLKVCSAKNPTPPCATPPHVIKGRDPDYSKEARKKNIEGTTVLWLIVGADGIPRDIRVARSVGYGLDEEAINAVKKWRFKPSTLDGHPVDVQINVEVTFRLH